MIKLIILALTAGGIASAATASEPKADDIARKHGSTTILAEHCVAEELMWAVDLDQYLEATTVAFSDSAAFLEGYKRKSKFPGAIPFYRQRGDGSYAWGAVSAFNQHFLDYCRQISIVMSSFVRETLHK